jgi:hypothetical protein
VREHVGVELWPGAGDRGVGGDVGGLGDDGSLEPATVAVVGGEVDLLAPRVGGHEEAAPGGAGGDHLEGDRVE